MNTLDRIMETTTDKSLRGLSRMMGRMASVAAFAAAALLTAAARADDPYIESDGTSGISTGYRMKGTSRLEVDFSMPNVDDPNEWNQCKVFGTDNATFEPNLAITLYLTYNANNQNRFFAFRAKTSNSNESIKYKLGVDTDRHTAIIDLLEDKVFFITGGATNSLVGNNTSFGRDFSNTEAILPLSLFGRFANTYATTFANQTKSRIYGVRIFENGIPIHNFVPCLKDGETPCFKDLVGGGFIIGEDVSKFTAGGDVPTYPDNAYVSTAANADGGKLYFDTGYKTTEKSAVALDCALTVNRNLGGTIWRLFQEGSAKIFDFNLNGNNGLRYQVAGTYMTDFTTAFKATLYDDKDVRRTFYLYNGGKAAVVTSGHTNQLVTFTQEVTFNHSYSLKLAANWAGNNEFSAIKIYGCKIWENGALVRDFAPYVDNGTPGLRDRLTGTFRTVSRGSGDTTSTPAYGGDIMGERDAYLEPTGSVGINTGAKLNGRSRFEVDYALTVTNANTKNWRVFGTDTQESVLKTWLGYDSANNTVMNMAGNNRYPRKADTARHLAGMDLANGKFLFVTGTTTSSLNSVTTDLSGLEASLPLPIFGRYSNAEGTTYHNYTVPSARIFSVRIYESDALVHEFIPYSRGGTVGLYDTVTGDIVSNGSSFSFGGAGQDHGQLKAYISPVHATEVNYGKTVTLTAYAPGATSYRWLMDGEPVAGGADGTFTVTWARGGVRAQGGYRHEYQAVAVFDDFYGVSRESAPSTAATVTSLPRALIFIVK